MLESCSELTNCRIRKYTRELTNPTFDNVCFPDELQECGIVNQLSLALIGSTLQQVELLAQQLAALADTLRVVVALQQRNINNMTFLQCCILREFNSVKHSVADNFIHLK